MLRDGFSLGLVVSLIFNVTLLIGRNTKPNRTLAIKRLLAMLWIKALHIIFMVTWFAGLFYLPRIFVYHSMSRDTNEQETFKTMERKLLIMTHIGALLTLVFGTVLMVVWLPALLTLKWMQLKLLFVVALIIYHLMCVKFVRDFKQDMNTRTHKWYRLFNEVPVLFLFAVVILVVVRPF